MTIRVDSPGLWLDDVQVIAGPVEFEQDGGDLRFDEQDEQVEDEPVSVVNWHFTGWEPRRFRLQARIAEPVRGGRQRYDYVKLIAGASRGKIPQLHTLLGPHPEALLLDSEVVIESISSKSTTDSDALMLTVRFLEFDPERMSLVTEPDTPDAPGLPDDEPSVALGTGDLLRIETVETEFGPQPQPAP